MKPTMSSDESPIIREVRERALKIDERFDHDLHKYCVHLREQEQKHPHRVVDQITVIRSPDNSPHLPATR